MELSTFGIGRVGIRSNSWRQFLNQVPCKVRLGSSLLLLTCQVRVSLHVKPIKRSKFTKKMKQPPKKHIPSIGNQQNRKRNTNQKIAASNHQNCSRNIINSHVNFSNAVCVFDPIIDFWTCFFFWELSPSLPLCHFRTKYSSVTRVCKCLNSKVICLCEDLLQEKKQRILKMHSPLLALLPFSHILLF